MHPDDAIATATAANNVTYTADDVTAITDNATVVVLLLLLIMILLLLMTLYF
jgi:hypothetical protein